MLDVWPVGAQVICQIVLTIYFRVTHHLLLLIDTVYGVTRQQWRFTLFFSGLFVPMIMVGGTFGRLFGEMLQNSDIDVYVGTYALVGAAAVLGGVVRMTGSATTTTIITLRQRVV